MRFIIFFCSNRNFRSSAHDFLLRENFYHILGIKCLQNYRHAHMKCKELVESRYEELNSDEKQHQDMQRQNISEINGSSGW